jgi:hypothetical protein
MYNPFLIDSDLNNKPNDIILYKFVLANEKLQEICSIK